MTKTKIKEQFVISLQGKDFVTHEGLLDAFHENNGKSITTSLERITENGTVIFKAKATGDRGTYTGYGDANKNNVNKLIAKHMIRMAETRAVNRALRLYNNIGLCSIEELTDKDEVTTNKKSNNKKTTKGEKLDCDMCNNKITRKVADYSSKNFGKLLCMKCQDKARDAKKNQKKETDPIDKAEPVI